jgi:signal peptidase II
MQMKNKRSLYIISLVILNIILDQLSKFWIRGNVAPYSDINIIADYFIITNVENSGAFLGLGSDFSPVIKSILLLALPVGVLVTVLVYVFKDTSIDKLSLIGYSSIIGGGIGNIYDRFLYGSVTDFLFIDLGGVFKTGIFNIADLSVTTGMILIVCASFKTKNE